MGASFSVNITEDINVKFMITVLGRISNENKGGGFHESVVPLLNSILWASKNTKLYWKTVGFFVRNNHSTQNRKAIHVDIAVFGSYYDEEFHTSKYLCQSSCPRSSNCFHGYFCLIHDLIALSPSIITS